MHMYVCAHVCVCDCALQTLRTDDRKEELQRQWGFECACEACSGLQAQILKKCSPQCHNKALYSTNTRVPSYSAIRALTFENVCYALQSGKDEDAKLLDVFSYYRMCSLTIECVLLL